MGKENFKEIGNSNKKTFLKRSNRKVFLNPQIKEILESSKKLNKVVLNLANLGINDDQLV